MVATKYDQLLKKFSTGETEKIKNRIIEINICKKFFFNF